jgi:hypothetical protein
MHIRYDPIAGSDAEALVGENDSLLFRIMPAAGGRILNIFNKRLNKEFLWHKKGISPTTCQPGDDYDANFWGGMDELLPNDIPEKVDSIDYPDHGELWTLPLSHKITEDRIRVYGVLPKSRLYYSKTLRLADDSPEILIEYEVQNRTDQTRHFLWKLHPALTISAGDRLVTRAQKGQVVDPAYSRFTQEKPFAWPHLEGQDVSIVPERNDTMDFFYLFDNPQGEMALEGADGSCFMISYDPKIFPYQWYFASFGGFLGHYTAILEPCSAIPIQLNVARELSQCSCLKPGEQIHTTVRIYAGITLQL